MQIIEQLGSEKRKVYFFNMLDLTAVLVRMEIQEKPKGKRIWRIQQKWDRYENRFNEPSPELPMLIRDLAKAQIMEQVKVKTWEEWKNNN